MGRVYFWCLPRAETINFHQFLAVGDDCSVETTQKCTGLRGCSQIPAAFAHICLSAWLSRSGSVQGKETRHCFKNISEKEVQNAMGMGGGGLSVKTHRQMLTPASIYTQTHTHTHTQGFYCVGAQCGFQAQKLLYTRPE